MELGENHQDGFLVLALQGRIDASNAQQLEDRVVALIEGGETRLVLDCTRLDYLSSAGMRVCLLAAKMVRRAQGKLAMAAVNEEIHHIFELAGFARMLVFQPSAVEAIKALT